MATALDTASRELGWKCSSSEREREREGADGKSCSPQLIDVQRTSEREKH